MTDDAKRVRREIASVVALPGGPAFDHVVAALRERDEKIDRLRRRIESVRLIDLFTRILGERDTARAERDAHAEREINEHAAAIEARREADALRTALDRLTAEVMASTGDVVAEARALDEGDDDPGTLDAACERLTVCTEMPTPDGWTAGACAVGRSDVTQVLAGLRTRDEEIAKLDAIVEATALLTREVMCEQVYRERSAWSGDHPCRSLGLRTIAPEEIAAHVTRDVIGDDSGALKRRAALVLDAILASRAAAEVPRG